jgi:hypothetical protein
MISQHIVSLIVVLVSWHLAFCSAATISGFSTKYVGQGGGQTFIISGNGLMGPDMTPPTVVLGDDRVHATVEQFLSGPTQITVTLPAMPHEEWYNLKLQIATGEWAQCDVSGGCGVRFDYWRSPRIERVLTPQLESGDLLGLYADAHSLYSSDPNALVMKLGGVRCKTMDETGEASLSSVLGEEYVQVNTQNFGRRRRRGDDTNEHDGFMKRRAYCDTSDSSLRRAGRLNVTASYPDSQKGDAIIKQSAMQISAEDGLAYMVESIPKVSCENWRQFFEELVFSWCFLGVFLLHFCELSLCDR